MTGFQIGNVLLFVACYASFAWAMQRFFCVHQEVGLGMRLTMWLGTLFLGLHVVALIAAYRPNTYREAAGAALYSISLALFWWAVWANRRRPLSLAYSDDAPEHLVCWGPYARIRHPFYTSYSIAWLAGTVATGQLLLLVTVVVTFLLYWRATEQEEAKFVESPLGQEYRAYRQRTGRFLPRLRPGGRAQEGPS